MLQKNNLRRSKLHVRAIKKRRLLCFETRRRLRRRRRLNCVINIPDIYCFEGKRGTFEVEREQEQKKKNIEMEFSKLFVAKIVSYLSLRNPAEKTTLKLTIKLMKGCPCVHVL